MMAYDNVRHASRTSGKSQVKIPTGVIILVLVLVLCLHLLISSMVMQGTGQARLEPLVVGTFALNGCLGIVALMMEVVRRPFSLAQVHWIFYIVFFCVAPFSQYYYAYYPWGWYLTSDLLVSCNLFLFLWGLLFLAAFTFGVHRKSPGKSQDLMDSMERIGLVPVTVLVVLSLGVAAYLINEFGLYALLIRRGTSLGTGSIAQIVEKFIRGLPAFALLFAWIRRKQVNGTWLLVILAAVALLVVDFPVSIARYNVACVYGGLLIVLCTPLRKRRGLFTVVLILGLLVVFPVLAVFRNHHFTSALLLTETIEILSNLPQGFCNGAYDAYSMFARTVEYVSDAGVSNGWQLLSALLFFIPRTIWPGKGIGTGAMIASAEGQSFTNVSCPLPAEGYVNFGIIGLVVFALLVGYVCGKLDGWYWHGSSFMRLFHPFACMLFFFLLRGDLLSGFAYTVGYLAVFIVALLIVKLLGEAKEEMRR